MAIDSSFISELKFRLPVEEVIGGYLSLKRAGSRYVACCPFHNEKTPSFTVFPNTSSYYCFGCGEGGDIITFTMRRENLDYVDAVKLLASRAGLTMPDDKDVSDARRKARERMLEMHKIAARHYYDNLKSAPNPCLDYLKQRGLDSASVTRYGLGYAKDSFDDLKNLLLEKGYSLQEMQAAGLLAKSQKNGSYYDKFRDRLMFPVIDLRGNVIAFSGRTLSSDKGPKYMNSPDTDIYKKGEILFGLNLAKEKNDGMLILCEGNIDVVMLSQAGFKNAIAPLGTAFTTDQARIIAKYAKTVVISFDSDAAGQKATSKAIDYLKSVGISVRVLQMQGAKDPDEFIKKYGKERFDALIHRSKTPTEYHIDKLKSSYDLSDTAQKMEYISKCTDVISALASAVEREIYAVAFAKEMEISPEILRADIERRHKALIKNMRSKELRRELQNAGRADDRVNPQIRLNTLAAKAEQTLIVILAKHPDLIGFITERITLSEFVTDFNRDVFGFIAGELEKDASLQSLSLSARFDKDQVSRIIFLLNTTVLSDDVKSQAQDCINTIKSHNQKNIDIDSMTGEQLARIIKKGDK